MMNMMYGFGGWWFMGMGLMILFWVAMILLVIWAVRNVFPRQRRSGHEQALEILQQRFAKGEMSAAEFEQAQSRLKEFPIV